MRIRKTLTLVAISLALGGTASAGEQAGTQHDRAVNETADSADGQLSSQAFVTRAAEAGLAEVELGRLGSERAQDPQVKQFARQMVNDHSKANAELKSLATAQKMDMPREPNARQRMAIEKLGLKKGADFDRAFAAQMARDHSKAVKLFRQAAQQGTVDEGLRQFAATTLPTLEHHKQEADNLNTRLAGSSSAPARRAGDQPNAGDRQPAAEKSTDSVR